MKKIYTLIISLLLVSLSASAQDYDYNVYIIPASADGTVTPDASGNYSDMVQLSTSDGDTYTASDVAVTSGKFAVYVEKRSTQEFTFNGLPPYAVTPIPANYPSPLTIASTGTVITLPGAGVYDFEYYTRSIDGISTNMIVAKPTATSGVPEYPQKLYLMNASGASVEVQGDATTGEYAADVIVPADFKISYEPQYNVDAFIFGPTDASESAITLEDDTPVAIAYATNTSATFNVSQSVKQYYGYSHIEINLKDGYIEVNNDIQTGVSAIPSQVSREAMYYTIDGRMVQGRPTSSGIYIENLGGTSRKIIVSQ